MFFFVYVFFCEVISFYFNPLKSELNPTRHLLALVGARHIVHVSRLRVNIVTLEVVKLLKSKNFSG